MTVLLKRAREIAFLPISRNIDQDQFLVLMLGHAHVATRNTTEVLMNRLNPVGLGLTFAVTTAVLCLACAALVAIAPDQMVAIFQSLWHGMDVTMLADTAPPVTLQSIAIGLITISVFTFAVGLLFAIVGKLGFQKVLGFAVAGRSLYRRGGWELAQRSSA